MQAQLYNTRNATKPSKTYRKKKTKQKKNNYKQILFSLRLLFLGIFFEIVFSEYSQEKQSCSYETRSIVRLNSDSFDIYTCVLGFFFLRCFQYKVKYTHCMLDKWNLLPFLGFGYSILHAHETCCDQNKQWAVLKKLWLTSQTHCHSPFKDFKSDSGALNLLFQLIHKLNWQRIDRDRYGDRCTSVVLSCVQHYDT